MRTARGNPGAGATEMTEINSMVSRVRLAQNAWRERELRELLGRWVSGCDPEMIFVTDRYGWSRFVGLGLAGDPGGHIQLHARPEPSFAVEWLGPLRPQPFVTLSPYT